MQQKLLTTLLTILVSSTLWAQEPLPQYGVESRSSEYFSQQYQYNDLVHYLDNRDLYVTYQSETTGRYNEPEQLIFSIEGNSYRWNSYYLDGFRVDNRLFSGSTLYKVDLYNSDLRLDYIGSNLYFDTNSAVNPSIEMSYNTGGLGGISPGTADAIHLFHPTASDRVLYPILYRNKINSAGTIRLNYSVERDDRNYNHSLYTTFGERNIVSFGNTGINSYYPETYGSIQLNGELPTSLWNLFDNTYYLYNFSSRSNLNSEFYYNEAETASHMANSASIYGKRQCGRTSLTSGVTLALHTLQHDDINFSRNIMDQDGEAFEPYAPDGNNFELSHSITLNSAIGSKLRLSLDSYNSLLYSDPSATEFSNVVYSQKIYDKLPQPLYLYKWSAQSYFAGLLENTLRLSTESRVEALHLRGDIAATLDGIILSDGKSKISPNLEFQAGAAFNPCRWFSAELTVARKRVAYSVEDVRYLSNDYLNGDIYYTSSMDGAQGDYFSSTGGALHTLANGVKQPSYWAVDIPLNFTFGRHRLSLLQSIRKYTNNWTTRFDGDASSYGYTLKDDAGLDIFFLNGGEAPSYIIDHYAEGIMGDSPLTDSPFLLSSNIEYSYTAPRFRFSFAWQSYMQSGLSTLGNGPLHNNIGVLSESSANPNTMLNAGNPNSEFGYVGRLDQERAYVMRMMASYSVTEQLGFVLNFKFKDGQPFSFYNTKKVTDDLGNTQIAIYPSTTRGINTFDANFGTREDACFNLDVRATYKAQFRDTECEFQLGFYNLYDFGTELTEYVFDEGLDETRRAMSLNIPRGVIFSVKIGL